MVDTTFGLTVPNFRPAVPNYPPPPLYLIYKFNVYKKFELFCTDLLRKMTTQMVVMTVAIIIMKIKATTDIDPTITPKLSELTPVGSKT